MPPDYPDYPSRQQILSYIRGFADTYGLRDAIQFNTEVVSAKPNGTRWIVTTGDGAVRSFDGLIAAPGNNWVPRMPVLKGKFSG